MSMTAMNSPLDAAYALLRYLECICNGVVIASNDKQSGGDNIQQLSSQYQSPSEHFALDNPMVEQSQRNFRLHIPLIKQPSTMFAEEEAFEHAQSLDELYQRIHTCTKCPLGSTRTKFVFGTGNPHAEIVFIGEAPGADEDAQGEPFVGRAGQLLTKILAAINLSREEVYICNILKCRPPNNRKPLPSEIEQCEPYLYKQLQLINPPFIVALGLTAAETLLRRKLKMIEVRGRWYDFYGARMLVTYHPAALLRNPELKRDTWEDVQRLRRAYDIYRAHGTLPEPTQA